MTITRKEIKNSNSHIYLQNEDFKGEHGYSLQTRYYVLEGGLSICKVCGAAEIDALDYSCEEYRNMFKENQK